MRAKTKTEPYDLIIIGGGAAGLSAAVSYGRKRSGRRYIVLEAGNQAGRKLSITGNGRCNLSNVQAQGYDAVRSFFESLGMLLDVDEAGRVYPMHRQAAVVRNMLVEAVEKLGGQFCVDCRVADIQPCDGIFRVKTQDDREYLGTKILLTTGGKAGPQYGCLGDGITIARRLGRQIVPILPSLAPLLYTADEKKRLSPLKGARSRGVVKLLTPAGAVAEARGEVQFTGDGLSGICIFDLSRSLASVKREATETVFRVRIDLAPDSGEEEILALLRKAGAAGVTGILNSRFAGLRAFSRASSGARIDQGQGNAGGTRSFDRLAASQIKAFDVEIAGTGGWKAAQTTSGGVALGETHPQTMQSLKIPGLFFAGEILDYDGLSGGWNLDFAFRTGIQAGEGAANA